MNAALKEHRRRGMSAVGEGCVGAATDRCDDLLMELHDMVTVSPKMEARVSAA